MYPDNQYSTKRPYEAWENREVVGSISKTWERLLPKVSLGDLEPWGALGEPWGSPGNLQEVLRCHMETLWSKPLKFFEVPNKFPWVP